jgi:GABA permease
VSKVLVVANETVGATELLDELRRLEGSRSSDYFVMVPAHPIEDPDAGGLASYTTPWNQEGAIGEAEKRLTETLAILKGDGLHATGEVGDMVPARAIEDALLIFDADTIVISTFPKERSRWLRKSLVEKTRSSHPEKEVIHIVSHATDSADPSRAARPDELAGDGRADRAG